MNKIFTGLTIAVLLIAGFAVLVSAGAHSGTYGHGANQVGLSMKAKPNSGEIEATFTKDGISKKVTATPDIGPDGGIESSPIVYFPGDPEDPDDDRYYKIENGQMKTSKDGNSWNTIKRGSGTAE